MRAVAIDGPAGAGKSSIAKRIAFALGYLYVDTGALYRAVGLAAYRAQVGVDQMEKVPALLGALQIALRYKDGEQRVFLEEEDVSEQIREPQIALYASKVSALPSVRAFLFDLQQDIAKNNNVIMDGRDIGTVVLPQADVKIFLTASVDDRAKRRYDQLVQSGTAVDFEELKQQIAKRDEDDSSRAISPLVKAAGAILVDTSGKTLEESVKLLSDLIKQKLGWVGS